MSAFLLDFFLGGLLWQPQSFPPKIFYQNIEEILLREKANGIFGYASAHSNLQPDHLA